MAARIADDLAVQYRTQRCTAQDLQHHCTRNTDEMLDCVLCSVKNRHIPGHIHAVGGVPWHVILSNSGQWCTRSPTHRRLAPMIACLKCFNSSLTPARKPSGWWCRKPLASIHFPKRPRFPGDGGESCGIGGSGATCRPSIPALGATGGGSGVAAGPGERLGPKS